MLRSADVPTESSATLRRRKRAAATVADEIKSSKPEEGSGTAAAEIR
jgi:hypothetical protein